MVADSHLTNFERGKNKKRIQVNLDPFETLVGDERLELPTLTV